MDLGISLAMSENAVSTRFLCKEIMSAVTNCVYFKSIKVSALGSIVAPVLLAFTMQQ
jgi:hypothetical protein